MRDGAAKVSAAGLGGEREGVRLPAIHLKNIGRKTGGAIPDQVMAVLATSLSGSVGKAAAPLALDGLTRAAEGGAQGAKPAREKGAKEAEGTLTELPLD